MSFRIYLSPPSQNGTEQDAMQTCLNSNWLAPVGPALETFEHELSARQRNRPVLALSSGTAAIHLALVLAGVSKGDEVLVASHTHNATVNPIIYLGATPIFVDSEEDTWNMSPEWLERALADRKMKGKIPKALILVHLYGMPAKLNAIQEIARKHGIVVIEDAAESLGSVGPNGIPTGSFGEFGILSFNGNKIITSGGGGALICSNENIKNRGLFLATQARDEAPHFEHSEIGYNYRMSNVLAALGNAQLTNLEERVSNRREIFNRYKESFEKLNSRLKRKVVSWVNEPDGTLSNRWLSTFLIEPYNNVDNESWRNKLNSEGIESRPLWKPMHLQPIFNSYPFYGNRTSDRIFKQGICLPSGTDLTRTEVDEITAIISSLYK